MPIVILGEPGAGKTHLARKLAAKDDAVFLAAGTLTRGNFDRNELRRASVVIVDGLDRLTNLAARRLSLFRIQLVTALQPLLVIAIGMSLLDLPAGAPHLLAGALLVVAVAVGLWGTRDAPLAPT